MENEVITEQPSSSNNFEEVTIKPTKKELRTDSYFDGSLLELIGWSILCGLLTGITFGFGNPWGQCMLYSYKLKHTVYNGKRLKFEGTGGDLFVNIFKWIFFTIITLGIYAFFIPVRKTKWVISNIHFEDEELTRNESYFDGSTLSLILMNILCNILNLISLGLLYPFTVCYKLRWINRHTVINRKKIAFSGTSISLFGKYILWFLLSIITFGIYSLWLPINMLKWQTKNTHIKVVGETEKSDNTLLIAIPLIILCIVFAFTLLPTAIDNVLDSEFVENIMGDCNFEDFNLKNLTFRPTQQKMNMDEYYYEQPMQTTTKFSK